MIRERSGWIIESIDADYVNISIYSPLTGSSYIELSDKVRNSKKGDINIKNNNNKCFLWCHIRHLNPLKKHRERITKAHKNWILLIKILGFLSLKNIMKMIWFISFTYQIKNLRVVWIYC